MTGDRELGLSYLSTYYQVSGLQFQGQTFETLVAYYDTASPSFIEAFGGSIRSCGLDPDEINSALKDLANANLGSIPDYRDFIPALIDQINGVSHSIRIVKLGTVDGVKQAAQIVETATVVGAGVYLIGLAVVAYMALRSPARA